MHAKMRNKKQINLGIIFVICLGLLITIFLSLKLGTKEINIRDFLAAFGMGNTNDDFIKSIIYKRIPRTIFAILAGSSLAISGVLMQSVTRNPIADPGILGINTGASLSVVIGLSFLGISSSISHISFAIIGGLVSAIFVYAIAVSGKAGLTPIKLALSGTCVSMALSSFVSFLILPNNNVLDKFRFWQIGSLGAATLSSISTLLPFIILGHLIAIFISSDLNALAMGDEMAVGLGVNVNRIRSLAIIASVLLCSSITAIGGPIGFVGLIVPHFCGLFISKDIRTMTISSSFIGAELLLICDIIGVTSSSSIAAVFCILVLKTNSLTTGIISITCGLTSSLILFLLAKKDGFSAARLIILGIGFQTVTRAGTSFLLLKVARYELQEVMRWLSGSLSFTKLDDIPLVLIVSIIATILVLFFNKRLEIIELGEEIAIGLGANPELSRLVLIFCAVSLTAFSTSITGPIACISFLAGPIALNIGKKRSPILAGLVGILLVLLSDIFSQNILPARYPVGVVTGLLGSPYLIYLLIKMNRRNI